MGGGDSEGGLVGGGTVKEGWWEVGGDSEGGLVEGGQ